MISHIIRAVAARLCSRCFYWKYQEEGQGRAVFLSPPLGLEGGGGAQRLQGPGQQAVFRPGEQLSGSPAQLCGAEVGCGGGQCVGCALREGSGGRRGGDCYPRLPPLFPVSRRPQRKKSWGEQVKGEEGGKGETCRPQGRPRAGGSDMAGGSQRTRPPVSARGAGPGEQPSAGPWGTRF